MALDLRELRELTRSLKIASVREEVDDNQVAQLADCLVEAVNSSENEELLLESLRALRNLVAGVKQNQIYVADKALKREGFNFWDLCIQDKSSVQHGDRDIAPGRGRARGTDPRRGWR